MASIRLHVIVVGWFVAMNLANQAICQQPAATNHEPTDVPSNWSLSARWYGTTDRPGEDAIRVYVHTNGIFPGRLTVRQSESHGGQTFEREISNDEMAKLYQLAAKAATAHRLGEVPDPPIRDGDSLAFLLHVHNRSLEFAVHNSGRLDEDAARLLVKLNSISSEAYRINWSNFSFTAQLELLENPEAFFLPTRFYDAIRKISTEEKANGIQRLQSALTAESVEVRRRAALALHELGDASGVPVMIQDLATENENDRNNVIVALRVMKDKRSLDALIRATDDKSPYVRSIALYAIGEMGAKVGFDAVARHVGDQEEYGGDTPSTPSVAACYALGLLGDKRGVPLLISQLDSQFSQLDAAKSLTTLTGKNFGRNSAAWKAWWAEQ